MVLSNSEPESRGQSGLSIKRSDPMNYDGKYIRKRDGIVPLSKRLASIWSR
jgi:hypothetical protein